MHNVINLHRIHVVDVDPVVNLKPLDAEVTTLIPIDDVVSNTTPLARGVELLFDVSIKPKGGSSHGSL